MKIPFYGIKRFYDNNSQEILDITHSVYSSGMLFGERSEILESNLCKTTGRKYAVTVNSCTDALYFALKASGIEAGDEVLVTSFSFIASASPILRAGAIPVFVDIDPLTFLMDLDDLVRKITIKTKAIIGVHLFGQLIDFERIEEIASVNKLILIEDAAQGFGSSSGNRNAGSMGDISCFSFDPTKIISAFSNGGAILTDDLEKYKFIKQIKYHGKCEKKEYEILGFNSRLSDINCALLTYQIKDHLESRIKRLNEIAQLYKQNLHSIPGIILPEAAQGKKHVYHKYVIRIKKRDDLKLILNNNGVSCMVHYPKPLSDYKLFSETSNGISKTEVCSKICKEVLSLPIFPELNNNEIDYICDTINSYKSKLC